MHILCNFVYYAYVIYISYCDYSHCVFCANSSTKKQRKPRLSMGANSRDLSDGDVVELVDCDVASVQRVVPRNKHGLVLTKSGRPSIKHNSVNEIYTTKYRNSANQEALLGKLLPIGKACAIIGTVLLGPDIPLEEAGHANRVRIFKSAAHYCLTDEDLETILELSEPELRLYLKGIFSACCRVLRYELNTAARKYFEQNVFRPAIKNPEIQAHLGLEMSQSIFDQ
jgi:hypothetical protein